VHTFGILRGALETPELISGMGCLPMARLELSRAFLIEKAITVVALCQRVADAQVEFKA